MDNSQLNATVSTIAAFRRRWDIGLRMANLPAFGPWWTNLDGALVLRRWVAPKYPLPIYAPAVGYAKLDAGSVAADQNLSADGVYFHNVDKVSEAGAVTRGRSLDVQEIVYDSGYIGAAPNAPTNIRVWQTRVDSAKGRMTWIYNPVGESAPPERFDIFTDFGGGVMDYFTVNASIDYVEGVYEYGYDSLVLTLGGPEVWTVLARSAAGVYSRTPTAALVSRGPESDYNSPNGTLAIVKENDPEDPDAPEFV